MGTCLMNPNWNFYVPIPGPKKFGEDETQKANWAVERLEAVHCFLDELAQKYLASYTDIWEYCWTQNLFLCIWEYPSKLCYTLCSKKTSKYPEQNMLTKPQICCGCCAYPGLLLAVLAVSSNKLDFYFPHNGPTGQAGPRQNHCNMFFLGSAWRFSWKISKHCNLCSAQYKLEIISLIM